MTDRSIFTKHSLFDIYEPVESLPDSDNLLEEQSDDKGNEMAFPTQIYPSKKQEFCKNYGWKFFYGILGCTFMTLLIVYITTWARIRNERPNPQVDSAPFSPTNSPTMWEKGDPLSRYYLDDIRDITNDPATLNDILSPQYKAVSWLNNSLGLSLRKNPDNLPSSRVMKEKYILVTLFYSTAGPLWNNYIKGGSRWLSQFEDDVCTWDGILCQQSRPLLEDNDSSIIFSISLPRNNLRGTLPNELSALEGLRSLMLFSNGITGSIPESYGSLKDLISLELYENKLAGNIPESFGDLVNLDRLYLSDNELSGSIPHTLTSLSRMKILWMSNNKLSSSIPADLGDMTSLRDIRMNGNSLTGEIPSSIGKLNNLEILHLNENTLTGGIPTALRSLANLGKKFFMIYIHIATLYVDMSSKFCS